jgi:hypothetical protein
MVMAALGAVPKASSSATLAPCEKPTSKVWLDVRPSAPCRSSIRRRTASAAASIAVARTG